MSTGSRSSCATQAGDSGEYGAASAGLGRPTGRSYPSGVAIVAAIHCRHRISTAPAAIRSVRPHERRSSIDRVLITVDRGRDDMSGRRSTSIDLTPYRDRVIAAAKPAGPAPTMRTGTLSMENDGKEGTSS